VYLVSERQLLMSRLISKKLGWSLFFIGMFSALILLLTLHHWLSAFLILVVLIMLVWIVLALVVPYFPHQPKTLIYGTAMIIVTALIGGFYVV
jgi:4-hydroxybenzoate polyprenyltransferase